MSATFADISDEARRNLERGPASGVCGHFAGGTSHCMRDFGHGGDHEPVDLAASPRYEAPPKDFGEQMLTAGDLPRDLADAIAAKRKKS